MFKYLRVVIPTYHEPKPDEKAHATYYFVKLAIFRSNGACMGDEPTAMTPAPSEQALFAEAPRNERTPDSVRPTSASYSHHDGVPRI
jgi:hypothetical protein